MLNAEPYSTLASIGSEHRIDTTKKLCLSLQANGKSPPQKVCYDWRELAVNDDLQKQYPVEIHNRFSALQVTNESTTENYEHFININKEVMEELIPKVDKKKRPQPSKDPLVQIA